ncbi:serine hydrolase domain-containing protein [Hymenobacter endophyticus]|uniref:Serine hydrolase domain-containing protein n=1 Tax=Hymenobacter endophyticus TaxID=3076335 RepID=A0ABU3TF67_9BACT|nr:serine hydrolase domain-containing protein [Hymenobacter endophyticus]MDU0370011.1 serine hydrolase domain-containing protein [Hymenobacter endophyticus]
MRLIVSLLLLLSLGRVGSSEAQSGVTRQLAAYMQGQQAVNQFAGVVLVTRHDSVLLHQAYGLADAEWQVPNTPDTRFALASITKQFTAIAVLQLAERGQLRLTDKLSQYVPGVPNGNGITLHQLLTHTAGLALDFEELYLVHTDATTDSALAFIRRQPVQFAPGARIGYSNVGYFLLGLVIEKASGLRYGTYLQRYILNVAGLHQSGLMSNTALVSGLARLYYREGAVLVKNPYINWELNVGHDGLYATAGDLLRFSQALRSATLLSPASLALMNTPHNQAYGGTGFLDRYGYGVFIDPYYSHRHHLLTHSGGYFGAMTTLDRYPQDEVVVIVLSNNQAESHIISYGLAGILFGKPVEVPYEHRALPAAPPVPPAYAGQYGPHHILYVKGHLYLQNLETPLVAETPTRFFSQQNPDRTVEFLPAKSGKVTALVLTKGGVRETFPKSGKPKAPAR